MAINVKRRTNTSASPGQIARTRWIVVAGIAAAAFFASYSFATARAPRNQAPPSGAVSTAAGATGQAGPSAASPVTGGGCCGGGAKGPAVTKTASVQGGVQRVAVDDSKGYFDPNTIVLKAGAPAEIAFGQGSGCLAAVQSQQLGFSVDLTGGPKTVKIAALQPGTYAFTCGMGMVSGTIVVR
jgi:plastocyanin